MTPARVDFALAAFHRGSFLPDRWRSPVFQMRQRLRVIRRMRAWLRTATPPVWAAELRYHIRALTGGRL